MRVDRQGKNYHFLFTSLSGAMFGNYLWLTYKRNGVKATQFTPPKK